ncbi:MAG TPA: ABC transporter ATP-binding protein [Streptosporangiaceae bacterium]|nr:ABC transporter ATP-binding protein [Streptosporangiaceae bacterium]
MSDIQAQVTRPAGREQPPGGQGRPPAVEMNDVAKDYDGGLIKALSGLSLRVERGEAVAVTGPSGCGKSTMLHLIAALDRPTSGAIRVGGVDLASQHDLPGYRRRHIGLVFQLHNLLPQLSAIQNVEVAMFGTGLTRRQRRERARALLADVGLAEMQTRPPTKLSGGERQRVAIARALANEPDLLLADEPTGSLDERSVDLVLDMFARLRAERPGMTMIIVTHDIRVAGTADRIIWLRDGRVDHTHRAIGSS